MGVILDQSCLHPRSETLYYRGLKNCQSYPRVPFQICTMTYTKTLDYLKPAGDPTRVRVAHLPRNVHTQNLDPKGGLGFRPPGFTNLSDVVPQYPTIKNSLDSYSSVVFLKA